MNSNNEPPQGGFFMPQTMKQNLIYIVIAVAIVTIFGIYTWIVPWLLSKDSIAAIIVALVLCLTPVVAVACYFLESFKD